MKPLTDEQAELLRSLRPKLRPLIETLCSLTSSVLSACPHISKLDADCPVCFLYIAFRDAETALYFVPDHVDDALMRGPHPNHKGKKRRGRRS